MNPDRSQRKQKDAVHQTFQMSGKSTCGCWRSGARRNRLAVRAGTRTCHATSHVDRSLPCHSLFRQAQQVWHRAVEILFLTHDSGRRWASWPAREVPEKKRCRPFRSGASLQPALACAGQLHLPSHHALSNTTPTHRVHFVGGLLLLCGRTGVLGDREQLRPACHGEEAAQRFDADCLRPSGSACLQLFHHRECRQRAGPQRRNRHCAHVRASCLQGNARHRHDRLPG